MKQVKYFLVLFLAIAMLNSAKNSPVHSQSTPTAVNPGEVNTELRAKVFSTLDSIDRNQDESLKNLKQLQRSLTRSKVVYRTVYVPVVDTVVVEKRRSLFSFLKRN